MEPPEQSYEDGLLEDADFDVSNHEAVLSALLRVALVLQMESDRPLSSFLGWCAQLDNAVRAMDKGQSVRRVSQLLVPAVDVLDDRGDALGRFLRFSERVEAKIRTDRKKR